MALDRGFSFVGDDDGPLEDAAHRKGVHMARRSAPRTDPQGQLQSSSKPETDCAIRSVRLERFLAELAVRAVLHRKKRREDGDGDSTTVRS